MIDPKKKQKIRDEYEAGLLSIRELAKKHKVSKRTIETWIEKEKWIKGKNETKIRQSVAERNMEKFIKAGMEEGENLKVVIEAMRATTVAIHGSKNKDPETGERESGFAEEVPDHMIRLKGSQEFNKLTASYPVEKKEIEVKGMSLDKALEKI
jgi:uncharacterized protein YjcR